MEWFEGLPEALREAPFFKPGEDGEPKALDQVVSDLTHAAQTLGNSIRIPGPDVDDTQLAEFRNKAIEKIPGLMVTPSPDDDEAMASVYASLGRPAEADGDNGYKLPEIEGVDWSEVDTSQLKTRAHQYGMSQKQFTAMVTDTFGDQKRGAEAAAEAAAEQQQALKDEWGEAYTGRIDKVRGLLTKMEAPEYLVNMLNEGTLPAKDAQFLYAVADALGAKGEGNPLAGQKGGGPGELTPDEAMEQLSEIENRPDGALWDAAHPDHARLVKKRVELMQKAYPDSERDAGGLRA